MAIRCEFHLSREIWQSKDCHAFDALNRPLYWNRLRYYEQFHRSRAGERRGGTGVVSDGGNNYGVVSIRA
jgi:hypothetical protein